MTKAEIVHSLESVAREPGFLHSLAVVLYQNLFFHPEEVAEVNWRERLSFQEISFLVGLMIKQEVDRSVLPTAESCKRQVETVHKLFAELHHAHNQPFLDRLLKKVESMKVGDSGETGIEENFQEFFANGEMLTEPIFYGGSGAYDFQYWDFAPRKYQNDEGWISEQMGLTVTHMITIVSSLKKIQTEKHGGSPPQSFDEFCQRCLATFTFTRHDLGHIESDAFAKFIQAFAIRPGTVNQGLDHIGAYNAVESHPIVVLDEDLYFLPVAYCLSQSVYESPFYWMNKDSQYAPTAHKNRGRAAEDLTYDMLKNVFGERNVYKNVTVRKSKKEVMTDIDVLAIGGSKAIIVQAKSKKLTELARRGNDERLKKDFNEAVQSAYEQGLICRSAVIEKNNTLFLANGEQLRLNERIDDAYIVCLTVDHYPAVTYQVGVFLKRKGADPLPVAMSVFDFDIVTFYLKDPFELLYYLRQRTTLHEHFKASSEMALLGYHLRCKLFSDARADLQMIAEDFAQLIDANFPVMRGQQPKTKAMEKLHTSWRNDKFNELVDRLKTSNQPRLTDAVFFLYDLAGEGADKLIEVMDKTKQNALKDGKQHDFSMIFDQGKSGITFVAIPDADLDRVLLPLAMARKYKTKADLWIGLGWSRGSPNVIDAVVFNNTPWEVDVELQRLVDLILKPGTPL